MNFNEKKGKEEWKTGDKEGRKEAPKGVSEWRDGSVGSGTCTEA